MWHNNIQHSNAVRVPTVHYGPFSTHSEMVLIFFNLLRRKLLSKQMTDDWHVYPGWNIVGSNDDVHHSACVSSQLRPMHLDLRIIRISIAGNDLPVLFSGWSTGNDIHSSWLFRQPPCALSQNLWDFCLVTTEQPATLFYIVIRFKYVWIATVSDTVIVLSITNDTLSSRVITDSFGYSAINRVCVNMRWDDCDSCRSYGPQKLVWPRDEPVKARCQHNIIRTTFIRNAVHLQANLCCWSLFAAGRWPSVKY
jgi:hypothetical protein